MVLIQPDLFGKGTALLSLPIQIRGMFRKIGRVCILKYRFDVHIFSSVKNEKEQKCGTKTFPPQGILIK